VVSLCTKFQVSRFTRYETMNGGAKCRKWGGLGRLGGTRCHRQCHHSIECIFDFNRNYASILYRFYGAMLCIRGTSSGPVSVCLSVRPSQVGVLLKRLNIGSHKEHRTRDFSFLMPKISAKFDRDHPLRGRQMQVGWVKIGDFRQIARKRYKIDA